MEYHVYKWFTVPLDIKCYEHMYYHHCWACTEVYWHFDGHPEQTGKGHGAEVSGGLVTQHPGSSYKGSGEESRRELGPSPLGWPRKSDTGAGSYAKLGAQSGPSQSHGELGGLQASCSIIRRNFIANKIHLKIRFDAVVLTQTLSLLVSLSYGYMFAHYGFSRVITILCYFHRILRFCQKKTLSLRTTEWRSWCWLDKTHIFGYLGSCHFFKQMRFFKEAQKPRSCHLTTVSGEMNGLLWPCEKLHRASKHLVQTY